MRKREKLTLVNVVSDETKDSDSIILLLEVDGYLTSKEGEKLKAFNAFLDPSFNNNSWAAQSSELEDHGLGASTSHVWSLNLYGNSCSMFLSPWRMTRFTSEH